jgi:hypothetical protein
MSNSDNHLTETASEGVANNFSSEAQADGVAVFALTGYVLVIAN